MAENEDLKEDVVENEGQESEGHWKNRFNFDKKKILIIAAVFMVLLIVSSILLYFFVFKDEKTQVNNFSKDVASTSSNKASNKTAKDDAQKFVYIDMNEIIVNLAKLDGQNSFLKLSATLEVLGEENATNVKEKMPLIRDAFQIYLRELRADDLQGSAGIYRLKQELILRVNKITAPVTVSDVLFRDILVQ